MDKKHAGITAVILAILLALVYSQFRMWKNFDWSLFLAQTHSVSKFHILHGIALIYLAYVLRAVRWKIFLRPLRPQASTTSLVAPTLIGFTGLALLGRPGELIRPYLIARQQKLPFSSSSPSGPWSASSTSQASPFCSCWRPSLRQLRSGWKRSASFTRRPACWCCS